MPEVVEKEAPPMITRTKNNIVKSGKLVLKPNPIFVRELITAKITELNS